MLADYVVGEYKKVSHLSADFAEAMDTQKLISIIAKSQFLSVSFDKDTVYKCEKNHEISRFDLTPDGGLVTAVREDVAFLVDDDTLLGAKYVVFVNAEFIDECDDNVLEEIKMIMVEEIKENIVNAVSEALESFHISLDGFMNLSGEDFESAIEERVEVSLIERNDGDDGIDGCDYDKIFTIDKKGMIRKK